jgi:cathepsin B
VNVFDSEDVERVQKAVEIASGNGKAKHWIASAPDRFYSDDSMASIRDAKMMMGTFIGNDAKTLPDVWETSTTDVGDLPTAFDSRKQWGAICPSLTHVRDQGQCGSCWAHGSTEAFNDRYCIANPTHKELFSTEHTTSCCGLVPCYSLGCHGGHPGLAWWWLTHFGVVSGGDYGDTSEFCWPYEVPHSPPAPSGTPQCRSTCPNANYKKNFKNDRHRGKRAYMVHGVDNIKTNLLKFGPVTSAFMVFDDFMSYKGGVYTGPKAGAHFLGGHAIKIVGWGEEKDVPYWVVANSWGPSWGESGFFRIKIGSVTGIDFGASAGEAGEQPATLNGFESIVV